MICHLGGQFHFVRCVVLQRLDDLRDGRASPAALVVGLQFLFGGLGGLLGGLACRALGLQRFACSTHRHCLHHAACGRFDQHHFTLRYFLAQHLAHGLGVALLGLVQQYVTLGCGAFRGHQLAGFAARDDLAPLGLGFGLEGVVVGLFLVGKAGGVGTDVCTRLVPQLGVGAGAFGALSAGANLGQQLGVVQGEGCLGEVRHVLALGQVFGAAVAERAAIGAACEHLLGELGLQGGRGALRHKQGHTAIERARLEGCGGLGADVEQAQAFDNVRAAALECVGHGIAGQLKVVHQQLDAVGLVQWVEVFSVQVLDELHDYRRCVVGVFHQHGHFAQACDARRHKAALARDDFMRSVARLFVNEGVLQPLGRQAPHQQGLEYAVDLHGGGHFQQRFVFHDLAICFAAHQGCERQGAATGGGVLDGIGIGHSEIRHGQRRNRVAALDLVLPPARGFADDLALLARLRVGLAALEGGGVFVDEGLAANEWVFGGHGHADVELL